MSGRGLDSIARGSLQLLGGRLASTVARIAYVVAMTQALGPELYGLLAYGQSFYLSFLPLSAVGLAAIMVREVGIDRARGAETVDRMLALQLLTSSAATIACATAALFTEDASDARWMLVLFSLALFGRSLALWTRQVFIAYEQTVHAFVQEAAFRPGELVLAGGVLLVGGDVVALAVVHALTWWGQGLLGMWLIRKHLVPARPRLDTTRLAQVIREGVPLLFNGVTLSWLLEGALVLFRQTQGSEHEVGQMGLLMQLVNQINALTAGVVFAAAMPTLSRMASQGSKGELRFVEVVARFALLTTPPLAFVGAALGALVIPRVFGAGYGDAASLFGLALAHTGPLLVAAAANQVLVAQGRFARAAITSALAALIMSLTFYVGPTGLEITLYKVFAARLLWAVALVVHLGGLRGPVLGRSLVRPALVAALTTGVWLAAGQLGSLPALALSATAWGAAIWGMGVITTEEREILGAAWGTLRRRWPLGR